MHYVASVETSFAKYFLDGVGECHLESVKSAVGYRVLLFSPLVASRASELNEIAVEKANRLAG